MAHPNEELLQKGFDAFSRGDMDTLRTEVFSPTLAWHFPGRSAIAGDYRGEEVFGFFQQLRERSGGTFRVELEYIVAGEERAFAVSKAFAEAGGKRLADGFVGNYLIRNGRIVEASFTVPDQYAWDAFFS
jgi:uncharacterized protein